MATIVCQGLKSCLHDPQFVEPRTLRLRLSSPIPHHLISTTPLEIGFKSILSSESNHKKELTHEEKCHHDKPVITDLGSTWSFLQALSSSQQQNPSTPVYGKPSSSITRLSQKSLELCTENLGNESGTIYSENDIFDLKDENLEKRDEKNSKKKQGRSLIGKKVARVREFPPLLTTISGSESLQVRSHREEGRLILKAVKSPLKHTCFQVERSNGRVRLSVSKDFYAAPKFDLVPQSLASQEVIEAMSCDHNNNENEGVEGKEEQEEIGNVVLGEQEGRKVRLIGDLEEKGLKVEAEEGMDKFERLIIRRCKGGSEQEKKGLIKFEPCNWVAT